MHTSENSKNNSFRRRIWKKRLSFQENGSVEIKEVKPKHFWNPGHQDSGSHQIPNHLSPKSRKQNLFFHLNITTVWLITQKFDWNIPQETNIIEEVYIFVLILKEKNLKNSKWRIYTKKIIRILYSRYISIIKLNFQFTILGSFLKILFFYKENCQIVFFHYAVYVKPTAIEWPFFNFHVENGIYFYFLNFKRNWMAPFSI